MASGETKGSAGTAMKHSADSDFQQQRLKHWQPRLTVGNVIASFVGIGVVFLAIGAIMYTASQTVVQYESEQYHNLGPLNSTVYFDIPVAKHMKAPVFVYYKLTNFYQNHRLYVSSVSDEQLYNYPGADLSTCTPYESNAEGLNYYPCGLVAASIFNDSFSFTMRGGQQGNWTNDGIAWTGDLTEKFIQRPLKIGQETNMGPFGVLLPNISQPETAVWMRVAALPTFKKLHRIIHYDLYPGDVLHFSALNVYPVLPFGGAKSVVISTASWLGGQGDFLAFAYFAVGGLCLVIAAVFTVKHLLTPAS